MTRFTVFLVRSYLGNGWRGRVVTAGCAIVDVTRMIVRLVVLALVATPYFMMTILGVVTLLVASVALMESARHPWTRWASDYAIEWAKAQGRR
jgi:predicted tellurium resistance membrane protein TerC